MSKKIRNKFYLNLTFSKFIEAHNRAKKNKMYKNDVLNFELNLESNIVSLINSIKNDTYHVGKYYSFKVFEPKERIIHSLPYRDRVVHQWYVEEFIKPYIMPKFVNTSFACLPNKGTHLAVDTVQNMMRKCNRSNPEYYILKCDIKKYFNSIDTIILFKILKKYIEDKALLNFTYKILFENRPFEGSAGIPIGNYTSQYFANIYLNELDQYIKRTLCKKYYVRYMDDFILLLNNKEECIKTKQIIQDFLRNSLNLELNDKSRYFPNKMGVNFCGYRIFHTHRLLRNNSKKKIKRHVKNWNKKYKENSLDIPHTLMRINSWLGHSKHCNSYKLQQKILNKCNFLINTNTYKSIEKNLYIDIENFEKNRDKM